MELAERAERIAGGLILFRSFPSIVHSADTNRRSTSADANDGRIYKARNSGRRRLLLLLLVLLMLWLLLTSLSTIVLLVPMLLLLLSLVHGLTALRRFRLSLPFRSGRRMRLHVDRWCWLWLLARHVHSSCNLDSRERVQFVSYGSRGGGLWAFVFVVTEVES